MAHKILDLKAIDHSMYHACYDFSKEHGYFLMLGAFVAMPKIVIRKIEGFSYIRCLECKAQTDVLGSTVVRSMIIKGVHTFKHECPKIGKTFYGFLERKSSCFYFYLGDEWHYKNT